MPPPPAPPPPASISPSKLSPCQDLRWSYPPFTCGFGNDLVKVSSLVACIQIKALQLSTDKTTKNNYKGYLFQFSCFFLWHQHGKRLNQLCRWSPKKYFNEILKGSKGSSKLFFIFIFFKEKIECKFLPTDTNKKCELLKENHYLKQYLTALKVLWVVDVTTWEWSNGLGMTCINFK